jgi:hypothetical protein
MQFMHSNKEQEEGRSRRGGNEYKIDVDPTLLY